MNPDWRSRFILNEPVSFLSATFNESVTELTFYRVKLSIRYAKKAWGAVRARNL